MKISQKSRDVPIVYLTKTDSWEHLTSLAVKLTQVCIMIFVVGNYRSGPANNTAKTQVIHSLVVTSRHLGSCGEHLHSPLIWFSLLKRQQISLSCRLFHKKTKVLVVWGCMQSWRRFENIDSTKTFHYKPLLIILKYQYLIGFVNHSFCTLL